MDEYSIEWFRWNRDNHPEWLGTQALKLLELYEQLEAKMECTAKMECPKITLRDYDQLHSIVADDEMRALAMYIAKLEFDLETYRERHRDAKSNFATIQRLRGEMIYIKALLSELDEILTGG